MLKTWRNNFEWGGGGTILSDRPVTNSDLNQDRLFFSWECLNIFATGCLIPSYLYSRGARLLNRVKRGALFALKEVVIKTSISFP